MSWLTVTLDEVHLQAIDRLMAGSGDYVPDRYGRREAVPTLLMAYDRDRFENALLERQFEGLAGDVRRIERERDGAAAQVEVVTARLAAERNAHRDERRRHADTNRMLTNALGTIDRVRSGRNRYRDLLRAIDAALGDTGRNDHGGELASRVRRRLRERGIRLPKAPDANGAGSSSATD